MKLKQLRKALLFARHFVSDLCKMTPFKKDSPREVKGNICLIIGHLQYNKVNSLTRGRGTIRTPFFYLKCPFNL